MHGWYSRIVSVTQLTSLCAVGTGLFKLALVVGDPFSGRGWSDGFHLMAAEHAPNGDSAQMTVSIPGASTLFPE